MRQEVERIKELAEKLQLGQGEVYRIARDVTGEEVASLYDLTRPELTAIVHYLDQLQLVGAA